MAFVMRTCSGDFSFGNLFIISLISIGVVKGSMFCGRISGSASLLYTAVSVSISTISIQYCSARKYFLKFWQRVRIFQHLSLVVALPLGAFKSVQRTRMSNQTGLPRPRYGTLAISGSGMVYTWVHLWT